MRIKGTVIFWEFMNILVETTYIKEKTLKANKILYYSQKDTTLINQKANHTQ